MRLLNRLNLPKDGQQQARATCAQRWPAPIGTLKIGEHVSTNARAFWSMTAGCGLEAEVQAFESCIIEWLNINPMPSSRGRCTWCGKPETPSATVLPFGTEPGTHAWLHPECWPAWYRSRQVEAATALRKMGIAPGGS